MALGPNELRKPNEEDLMVITAMERLIDRSREFQTFRCGAVKVPFTKSEFREFYGDREKWRKPVLIKRYKDAGWRSVTFVEDGIIFSEVNQSTEWE
jgi:hypothetical protein